MYQLFFKRVIDLFLSIVGMFIFALLLVVLGPIIHFTDRGPIFYNAKRIGLHGKLFTMYKFRSMYVNAPDIRNEDGSTYNADDDPRVTPIGRFMRKTSLDEFPQFLNVFLGDMSIIGPRPDPPDDIFIYSEEQKQKLNVKPGITGYNQAYYRNSVLQDEKFEHDVFYANNISFILDCKIFFKTILVVLKHENVFNNASQVKREVENDEI